MAQEQEVLLFIERHGLMGRGIGYIDAHLLAATALTEGARLWTRDKRLDTLAHMLELAYVPALIKRTRGHALKSVSR